MSVTFSELAELSFARIPGMGDQIDFREAW